MQDTLLLDHSYLLRAMLVFSSSGSLDKATEGSTSGLATTPLEGATEERGAAVVALDPTLDRVGG